MWLLACMSSSSDSSSPESWLDRAVESQVFAELGMGLAEVGICLRFSVDHFHREAEKPLGQLVVSRT